MMEFGDNPYPAYARLRTEEPVRRVTMGNGLYAWLVTRFEDAQGVLGDPRMSKDPSNAALDWQEAGRGQPTHLLTTDPPEHTRLRRLVSTAFTPRRVESLRGQVQQIADALLDMIAPRGRADLIAEYAFPLPVTVICELLGVPAADRDKFRQWQTDFRRWMTGDSPPAELGDAQPDGRRELHAYMTELVAERRREPTDDMISALITARDAEDRLSEAELMAMLSVLLVAGFETSVNLIGNGTLALLSHPDQLALLRERPDLLASAVEEMLRYDGPLENATWRFALEPIEIAGTVIEKGQPVIVSLASADRDPARFAAPDHFDIARGDDRHLAFGRGAHYCLGAPLARLEGQVALGTLVRRLPGLALAVSPKEVRHLRSITIRGVETLPVTFES